ncbi:MAG: FAD:protein FMN transferase [candidate division Zixibacteria bacterium]|nr:FAD:protein FMN transferase [candidate division Zixibacteria bacterium]
MTIDAKRHRSRTGRALRHLPAVLLVAMGLLAGTCSGPREGREPTVIDGLTMGTTYTVQIAKHPRLSARSVLQIKKDLDSLFAQINREMSIYDNNSEISRFNRSRKTDWFAVSHSTAELINEALTVSKKTEGAFDVTVGPLVNLWGFGPKTGNLTVPGQEKIAEQMSHCGYRKLSARLAPPAIRKTTGNVSCDLSAIAKGHGVDRAAAYLDSAQIDDYLIEIGGEIKARGTNAENQPWQVGIAAPDSTFGVGKIVSLNKAAMATSGNYRNYFEVAGVRYSHIIDPRTGRPVTHDLASVTVIHDNCAYADAMATALIVLGPDAGYDLAVREGLATLMIVREGSTYSEKATPRFARFVSPGRERITGER